MKTYGYGLEDDAAPSSCLAAFLCARTCLRPPSLAKYQMILFPQGSTFVICRFHSAWILL